MTETTTVGMTHAHSPAHADPLEQMQGLAEQISASTFSYAMPYASAGLSLDGSFHRFMKENIVPPKMVTQLNGIQTHGARALAYGPLNDSELNVLYVGINVDKADGSGLRTFDGGAHDDVIKATALTQNVTFEDSEHHGDPERIVYILMNAKEFAEAASVLTPAAARIPQSGSGNTLNQLEPSQQFHKLLHEAVTHGASDIHLEPYENKFRIRLRVDGALQLHPATLDAKEAAALVSHIKVRGQLRIEEKRMEQAGMVVFGNDAPERELRGVSVRVSTIPTVFLGEETQAETCVLRIARRTSSDRFKLESLGYSKEQLGMLQRNLAAPDGLILLTGPTGSGKTTTLYSCLMAINQDDTKIITAEHPVEVILPGVVQTPVDPIIGRTFEYLLRGFLRQDPDVIMIGEIRDKETADAAVSAAITGHQVFSTMHVTRASEVVARLSELNIEPSQILGSLRLCIAQRLVRVFDHRLHDALVEYDAAPEINRLARMNILGVPFMAKKMDMHAHPHQEGLRGRTCVSEMWEPGDEARSAILAGTTDALALQKLSIEHDGLEPMFMTGLRLLREGRTSLAELQRTVLTGRDLREHPELVKKVAIEALS